MDRRGGMAPMMPFFPGSGLGDQPPPMPAPDMSPFPHMRERFPNSVWAPEGNQGQWGAFHPPGLAPPPMGPPAHPGHQYNQFEARQPAFNFAGNAPQQAPNSAAVTQFNNGFNSQYNGNPEPTAGYVPQGIFSPQTTTPSVPYSSGGAPSGFLGHPQGNGLINAANAPQPHPYPTNNEYAQQSHHPQQGIFKSPMPSPAVSGTDQSPIQTAFAVSSMPSPHTSNNHTEQTMNQSSIGCPQVGAYANLPTTDCAAASLPQNSPHANVSPCTSMGNNNIANVNSSVQSRLKTMIMSRQGTTGSHGSAFSPGLSDSPPPGELRFSGSVAAVTSVESSPDPTQVQESIKMAQNFLAYRTADSGPVSVVQHSSDEKGGSSADFPINQKPQSVVVNESVKSECDTLGTKLHRANYNSSLPSGESSSNNMNKDGANIGHTEVPKCEQTFQNKPDNNFKQPEEALEELFNGTDQSGMDTFLREGSHTDSGNTDQMYARSSNFLSTTVDELKNNERLPNLANNCNNAFVSPSTADKRQQQQPIAKPQQEYLSRCGGNANAIEQTEAQPQPYDAASYSIENCQKQPMIVESSQNVPRKEKGKSSNLSVYDFPDSPDQQPASQKGCAGFRLGRVRGAGLPITTTSTHCRPVCASAPLCGGTAMPTNATVGEDGRRADGNEQAKVNSLLNTLPPSLASNPQPFVSHVSSASALSSTINPHYTSFLPTTTVNSNCSTIPSLAGKDGHSTLHNKQQNCMTQSFQKQGTIVLPLSAKMTSPNQRQLTETFPGSDVAHSDQNTCNNINQTSSQAMSNISKNCPNSSMSQQTLSYNAYYDHQRNAMFSNPNQPPFPESSSSNHYFPCNNMQTQVHSNMPFNVPSQNSFNPKTGMPHSLPAAPYGHSNPFSAPQNPYFYHQGQDAKMQGNPDTMKAGQSLPQQNALSSLESLQKLSKNEDQKCNLPTVSPHQTDNNAAPLVSPVAHPTAAAKAAQPITPGVNQSSIQNISRMSPQRSSPQDIVQTLSQTNPHSTGPTSSLQNMTFSMMQGMSSSAVMGVPPQSQNSAQSLPNTSPINMPHPSPQSLPPHLSPHPSPQSVPLSSPQNMPLHTSPQNISHPSPQGMSHPSQNIMHPSQNVPLPSPQAMPQQASPQNFSHTVAPSLSQMSPQNVVHPSSQNSTHPQSHNTLHPSVQNVPHHMPLNVHHSPQQGAPHLQHNLPLKNSHPPHQNVLAHHPHNSQQLSSFPGGTAQNVNHLPGGSNFARPPTPSYSMPQASAQSMNNAVPPGMHPNFPSNYPPYGMPYQPMNHGYQHRMYSQMGMGPVNQVFTSCQHPIKSMSNIAMPQTMMQPCLPAEPPAVTKSRPKKGAPKKPRKPKETKQQKQKIQREENEKQRSQDANQQQFQHVGDREAVLASPNPMMFPNNQMVCQPWGQPLHDGMMQAPGIKQVLVNKIDHFPSQAMQFQAPQSWNPALNAMPNNKPKNLYPDHKPVAPALKLLTQDNTSLSNPCFPTNREEYTPLNMLNQQQSEIFKNIFDDSKTIVPSTPPTKLEMPKTMYYNTPVNNPVGPPVNNPVGPPVNNPVGPGMHFPPKAEERPAVTDIAVPTNENNFEASHVPSNPTAATQINPYGEAAIAEEKVKQECESAMSALPEEGSQNSSTPTNTQPANVTLETTNTSISDKLQAIDPSCGVLPGQSKEEAQQQCLTQMSVCHTPIDTATVYEKDQSACSSFGEQAQPMSIPTDQNIAFGNEDKFPQTASIAFTDDSMDIDQIKNRMKANELLVPKCSCTIPAGTPDSGPVYTHLGAGSNLADVRQKIKKQTGLEAAQIRIEKVLFSGKDGKTESGCPLPKWIIRRSGPEEKVLVVVKQRLEHSCDSAWIVIVIVDWEGFPSSVADNLYSVLVDKLNKFGNPTERRCGTNEDRTCACQGDDPETCGASYSFGCSWSMYYNMCKFARSKNTRKFKLTDDKEEKEVEEKLQCIATSLGPVYSRMAPIAYQHQVSLEDDSLECRLGKEPGRPWTGVTACLDFCSHAHKDSHNIHNGCTVVATLTKGHASPLTATNLREQTPPDEQLHVLPLYLLDTKDEDGGSELFDQKVQSGALEVLTKYPFPMRLRSEPLLSCRARNLLARGLPLPNSIRGKAKAKAKVVSLANIRRKSSGDNAPVRKNPKSDVKEVSDKLGLDVDFLLASGDLEDNYDDFSKYSIDSDDYSWILDLGNDDESTKSTSSSQPDSSKEEINKEASDTKVIPGYSGKPASLASTGTMPPPQSPAPRRTNSPGAMGTTQPHATVSPTVSPSMTLTIQSPTESPPPVLTPVPNLSPFSPQMPHLSPHASHSSPDSPKKNAQSSEVSAASSTVPEIANSLAVTHASLFSASHNSPEMPRLSPHVTLGAFSPVGLQRLGDKACPVSNMKQLTMQQQSTVGRSQSQTELQIKAEVMPQEKSVCESRPNIAAECSQFNTCDNSFFENNDGSPHIFTRHSDNYQSFEDPNVGGVGIALTHGSVLFEYARQELHSTTALRNPNRKEPKRISLVFYHHKNLIYRNHGMKEFEEKMEKKRSAAEKEEKEGKLPPAKKRKSTKRTTKDDKLEPPNGIKRTKFDLDEGGHMGMSDHKKGHSVSSKCATVFPPSHLHLPHHPDLVSPPISYANYPHNLPSFVDGGRAYSPSGQRSSNTPVFSLASKSPHLITSQSPSLESYSQKPIPTPDHNYGTPGAANHSNILPPFNTNLQEFNAYNGRGPSPYPGHFQPYMDMPPGNNFSSYQPSGGYFPKGHAPSMNYNTTTYVPQPFYGLTPPYSPGPQPHGQTVGAVQSQMPFAPGITQPITNPFDDSMRAGPMTNPTATWSQMRHAPSFHIHGPYSPWPGS